MLALALCFVVVRTAAHAQVNVGLDFGTATGLATTDIRTFVARIIRYFLALIGLVFVVLIMYAGYLWLTSGGNDEKIAKAKKILVNGVIGMLIIVSSYAIVAFLFQGITGQPFGGSGQGSGAPPCFGITCSVDRHSDALGNGIIQYHYPEPNQRDVPRNTRIAITFRKPLLLSTVIRNYDDKGTFDTADDRLCSPDCRTQGHAETAITDTTVLELNTDVIKIIQNGQLADAGNGSFDQQFATRYAQALTNGGAQPAVTARVTPTDATFNPLQGQTLVLRPTQPIGSATEDVDYRVALAGGSAGIRVWDEGTQGGTRTVDAFSVSDADGAYFWMFTTNTTIDTTPPQISALVPGPRPDPATSPLDRNQLLQMYFNEAVDPTSVSGVIGAGGGFTKMQVQAKCLPDLPCDARYKDDFVSVAGTLVIGNRYKTVEFTPSEPCENVSENSCGEPVFCLPKNVELRFAAKAASVGAEAPLSSADDGVVDMVGNSLDGNKNGTAEGPATQDAEFFSLNIPQAPGGTKDSARAGYRIGDTIDLTPPAVLDTDPKSAKPDGNPSEEIAYAAGPSKFPATNPIIVLWSKTLSITSIRTGSPEDRTSTVVLQSKECRKAEGGGGSVNCPAETEELPKPWYFIDTGVPETVSGAEVTRLQYVHRPFLTSNELGYTEGDPATQIPKYAPLLRAQLRDTKQNCFFPSVGAPVYSCAGTGGDNTSCCNRLGKADPSCPL